MQDGKVRLKDLNVYLPYLLMLITGVLGVILPSSIDRTPLIILLMISCVWEYELMEGDETKDWQRIRRYFVFPTAVSFITLIFKVWIPSFVQSLFVIAIWVGGLAVVLGLMALVLYVVAARKERFNAFYVEDEED